MTGILEALQQGQLQGSRRLSFALDNESTLQVGNVIKGKVMRHYEGSRYSVEFGGRERVVDSSIPFNAGDVIHGRVVAIDDKVHLQRLKAPGTDNPQTASALNQYLDGSRLPGERIVLQLFDQYQARISSADLQALSALMAKARQPELMALSALILSKMGAHLEPDFIRAIYRQLQEGQVSTRVPAGDAVLTLMTAAVDEAAEQSVVPILAALITQLHQQQGAELQADTASPVDSADETVAANDDAGLGAFDQDESERRLGERLLNVQNDNSVAHRMLHFPVWLGDRLVEIQVAFFAQKQQSESYDPALGPYRKIVFSLDTESIGHVEIAIMLANRHARVEFVTGNSETSAWLARYSGEVESALAAMQWQTDELRYSTSADFGNGVLGTVVEHYITQDSFSRLM
ncbi:MAG: flagellar hook-length control protein FliK [Gammaproteobacteria bacterium]|nr:flagellar hook-length control protein FliK [Gammaproteobacteria bacterium]